MLTIPGMLGRQMMIFLLLGLGVFLGRRGVITDALRTGLSDLVLYLFMPCSIVSSSLLALDRGLVGGFLLALGIAFAIQGAGLLLCWLLFRRAAAGQKPVLRMATICSNAVFMGLPVVEGFYGQGALVYASAYLLAMNVVLWTVGMAGFVKADAKTTAKQLATQPAIIATVLGFVLLATGARLPGFLTDTLQSLGGCTTAVSMLVIGSILSGIRLRSTVNRQTVLFSVLRLALLPLLVLGALLLLKPPPLVTAVSVVLAAMPAGATTTIVAEKTGGDDAFATQCVFLSTVLSILTVPALALLTEAVT